MKRLAFLLAPLMAITFLTNCGSSKQYTVTVETHKHLSFTSLDGKDLSTVKAIEGQDFKFKMKTENVSNDIEYVIPTALDIKIDDKQPLAPTFYTITSHEGDKEADVLIKGIKVVGNITISGSAAVSGQYNYKISNHDGLDINVPSEGSKGMLENLVITFTPQAKESGSGTYAKPKAENILIQFDKVPGENPIQWVSPSEMDVSEFCTFNEGSGELTIKPKYIKNNIDIKTRSSDYPVLEKKTWEEIESYSFSGYTPYVFYIGEEKTVKVNEIDQKVRIIDFNHDELSTSTEEKKQFAGITFEFVNLLSDKDGYSLATLWNTKNGKDSTNYNYLDSDLRRALDGIGSGTLRWYQKGSGEYSKKTYTKPVIDMLPDELKVNIKTVKKYVANDASYTVKDYDAKVFALTHDEMTKSSHSYAKAEGTIYKYYEDHDNESSRIKHQIKWHTKAVTDPTEITDLNWKPNNYAGYNNSTPSYGGFYWLSSPYTNYSRYAWSVYYGGYINYGDDVCNDAFAVAPAFCI